MNFYTKIPEFDTKKYQTFQEKDIYIQSRIKVNLNYIFFINFLLYNLMND